MGPICISISVTRLVCNIHHCKRHPYFTGVYHPFDLTHNGLTVINYFCLSVVDTVFYLKWRELHCEKYNKERVAKYVHVCGSCRVSKLAGHYTQELRSVDAWGMICHVPGWSFTACGYYLSQWSNILKVTTAVWSIVRKRRVSWRLVWSCELYTTHGGCTSYVL